MGDKVQEKPGHQRPSLNGARLDSNNKNYLLFCDMKLPRMPSKANNLLVTNPTWIFSVSVQNFSVQISETLELLINNKMKTVYIFITHLRIALLGQMSEK